MYEDLVKVVAKRRNALNYKGRASNNFLMSPNLEGVNQNVFDNASSLSGSVGLADIGLNTPDRIIQVNNQAANFAALQQQHFEQSSANQAMAFESAEAQKNRDFQQMSVNAANAFSALEAQKNRDWYDAQRSTAYQTAVDDLRAAGLNPALAYAQGGAASTSGAVSAGLAASGSSASGSKASGSMAQVDLNTARDIITTAANSAVSLANTKTYVGAMLSASLLQTTGNVFGQLGSAFIKSS